LLRENVSRSHSISKFNSIDLRDAESNIALIGHYDLDTNSEHTGFAYLFGNENYETGNEDRLPLVATDLKFMSNALEALKFKVTVKKDKPKQEMLNSIVDDIVEEDLSEYSCFLFYFAGHGINGKIYGKDMEEISIMNDIIGPIGTELSVSGKPMFFFFDCCRSKSSHCNYETHRDSWSLSPNIYVAYATSEFSVSNDGAWTQYLAEGLLEGAFPNAPRWLTSVHNVVAYARMKAYAEKQQLSVTGDDTLLKFAFLKDLENENKCRRYKDTFHHAHKFLFKSYGEKKARKCMKCGETNVCKAMYVCEHEDSDDAEEDWEGNKIKCRDCCVCVVCILDFEKYDDGRLLKTFEKKHQNIKMKARKLAKGLKDDAEEFK
jgi:hypothetical protein